MRRKIYNIIEPMDGRNKFNTIYDIIMIVTIIISIIPLAFKTQTALFFWIDIVCVSIFIIDYLLRLITADYKLPDKGKLAFIIYPFTPMAIIDLLSILPSIGIFNSGLKLFRLFRLARAFRVFRVLKLVRYSKNMNMLLNVFRRQKKSLLCVCALALSYILISALIVFNVEPDTFNSFFIAVYWATISLTTVGYGDVYPITNTGRIVAMISSLFGIAIIALPSGIITAGYMEELKESKS